LKLTRYPR